jgi:hypothetical protein
MLDPFSVEKLFAIPNIFTFSGFFTPFFCEILPRLIASSPQAWMFQSINKISR